jgi:hypothetical protein
MAGRPKGLPKTGGGNRKGVPNKATKAIKDMIEGALSAVGGQKYLEQQAIENPVAFMGLVGKILPKDINAKVEGQMVINVTTGIEH